MGLGGTSDTAPLDVGGFEVGWRDAKGEHRRPLSEAEEVEFETGLPVRGFPSYRGQRNFPGLYWSATTGGHVGFESWLERDHAMLLDFTPEVTGLLSQPLWLFWQNDKGRVEALLAEQHGAGVVPMPSKTTFYRLVEAVSAGTHAFGSAASRRSQARRPEGMFTPSAACRPGELVQIDTTPLDVLVILEDGVSGRPELTIAVDVATRTICAAVLRPAGTKAVEARDHQASPRPSPRRSPALPTARHLGRRQPPLPCRSPTGARYR
ncbi:TnsA-like heteromeric transposase endonuclease subunit [Streptomyces brevispora]|uniref:TnsA-like heteromeric transposase endonuclease subunit n=1 Tax=Streptomyces brevispora TaxID=887462 RepID=A0A561UZ98_9ACTN|nr:TnsA-like heteromeric transposase endonuclease subunit [Streptomyces brevispora]TWG04688.1 hypothetical protein FHX80_113157 [Streptomyces brevispora]WSC17890.1 TnsA-like heteromeric transposase endonuclease subunit [Streptomyces brevispora]